LIFSLLNVRKKTAAILAGITIAVLCLWGLSIWQNISLEELFRIFMATIIMLGAIMLGAFMLIVALKLLKRAYHKATQTESSEE
jgi:flagellar motor component MotA